MMSRTTHKLFLLSICATFVCFQFIPHRAIALDSVYTLALLTLFLLTYSSKLQIAKSILVGALAFAASALLSTLFSIDLLLSISRLLWLTQCALMALIVENYLHVLSGVDIFDTVCLPLFFIVLLPAAAWVNAGYPLFYRWTIETNNLMSLVTILIFPAWHFRRLWLVALGVFVAWFTTSRAGTLALLAGWSFYRVRWILLIAAASVIAMPLARESYMSTAAIASDVRGGYWSVAFEMWRSSPIVGMGLWSGLYYQTLGHAHNIWLNTLAEQGIIGVSALAILLAAISKELWRSKQWWAIASWVALNAHSLFDIPTTAAYITLAISTVVVLALARPLQYKMSYDVARGDQTIS